MISDALLHAAAAEAEAHLLKSLPEVRPHQFSPRFERKMKQLISRANHPVRYQVLRYAAAVLIAVLSLFGTVMAVSPEARAAVVGWVKSTFFEFSEYSTAKESIPNAHEYYLAVVPEGYTLMGVSEKTNGKAYLYVDDAQNVLQFSYAYRETVGSLFVKTEDYQHHLGDVNENNADIYIANKRNEASVIVWEDSDVLFYILAMADQVELIKIAETVQKTEK